MTNPTAYAKLMKVFEQICHEPNYEIFEYKGHPCLIRRVPITGCLCGYVGMSKDKEKLVDQNEIDCYGGITFSGDVHKLQTSLLNINIPSGLYWIGFDTAHAWDFMPFMAAMNSVLLGRSSLLDQESTYKDINFMRSECKNIVDQLQKDSSEQTDAEGKDNQSDDDKSSTNHN